MKLRVGTTFVLLVAGLLALAAPANAAIITYSSRAAFAAGVVGETIENWDSLADGTVIAVLDGIIYTSSTGSAVVTDAFLPLSPPNGLGRTPTEFFAAGDTMTFTFPTPISAFAISINTFATTPGAYSATTNLGDVIGSFYDPFVPSSTGQFVGFSSTIPFTSVKLAAETGFSYTLDDMNYLVASVPEPASATLLGLAAAVALYRRRRR